MGILTSTTLGMRRAITKPASVIKTVRYKVQCALGATHNAACRLVRKKRAPRSTRSRSKVKTNKEERNPMAVRPTHDSASANLRFSMVRVRTDSGINQQQATSSAMPANTSRGPSDRADNSRQPTYPGSNRKSQMGLKSRRRIIREELTRKPQTWGSRILIQGWGEPM